MTDADIQAGDDASACHGKRPPRFNNEFVGRLLTLIGLTLFAISASPLCEYPALLAVPPWTSGAAPAVMCFWLAVGFSIAGVTLYAISRHRHPAWGLLGGIPLAGPVLGLVSLTPKSQTEVGFGRAHFINELLRLSGYLIGLMITVWEVSSRWDNVVTWLTTSMEKWSPSLESCCLGVSLEIPMFVLWGLSFALLGRTITSCNSQGMSPAMPWLLARTAFLALSLLAILAISLTSLAARNVFDQREIDALTTLHVGLPRQAVEATIEEANRAILTAKHPDGRSVINEANEQIVHALRDTRHETRNGERVLVPPGTLQWPFRNALFSCSGKEGDRKVVCWRHYTRGSDPDYGFSLRLTFNENNTLASARLQTSKHQPRGKCRLVFEIPPSEQRDPSAPCQS